MNPAPPVIRIFFAIKSSVGRAGKHGTDPLNSLALKEACHVLRIQSVSYQVYVVKILSSPVLII
jgi:hypothetical protein